MSDTPVTISEATAAQVKTSLSDFMAKIAPKQESDASDTSDNNVEGEQTNESESNETTESTASSSDNNLESEATSDEGKTDTGASDNEQAFDVNGAKVPLKDLVNSFETRSQISKRFDDLGKEKQKIEKERERLAKEKQEIDFINEKFAEMQELVLEGNSLGALQIALAMAPAKEGELPKSLEELVNQAVTIAENYQSMSEEERKLFLKEEKLRVDSKKLEKDKKKQEARDQALELENYYAGKLDAIKATDEEMSKAVDDIANLPAYKEKLEALEGKARIDYCANWVLGQRYRTTVENGIKAVSPALAKDNNFLLALINECDPRCTQKDIENIVRKYVEQTSPNGSAKVESGASKKSVETKKSTTSDRAPTDQTKAENNKPITDWKELVAKYT